jgi:ubiquinone/menaquinone biosynthesis C-methylase UbiE
MIQNGFDTAAAGYDHRTLSIFPETAKRLVEPLQLNPVDHLHDVCTGTVCVALAAVDTLTQGKVTGIDLASGNGKVNQKTVQRSRQNKNKFPPRTAELPDD